MAELNYSDDPASLQHPVSAFQAFHDYTWDLDKDFLVSRYQEHASDLGLKEPG